MLAFMTCPFGQSIAFAPRLPFQNGNQPETLENTYRSLPSKNSGHNCAGKHQENLTDKGLVQEDVL
jgi:hypothetical protein